MESTLLTQSSMAPLNLFYPHPCSFHKSFCSQFSGSILIYASLKRGIKISNVECIHQFHCLCTWCCLNHCNRQNLHCCRMFQKLYLIEREKCPFLNCYLFSHNSKKKFQPYNNVSLHVI